MANQRVENTIVERRKEVMMTSFLGLPPKTRFGHFLIPSGRSIQGAAPDFPNNISIYDSPNHDPTPDQTGTIQVDFKGWKRSEKKWISWYEDMKLICQPIWERAGIHHALKNSTYSIRKINQHLLLAFAEKWCPNTQSFVFPWGECTITHEDVMLLGGYPVLGNSILGDDDDSTRNIDADDDSRINEILERKQKKLVTGSARKANHSAWLKEFAGRGSQVEHEAFLAHWLTRLVIPTTHNSVVSSVFPIATRLARGEKIALAPVLLARLYHDLTLLKSAITTQGINDREPISLCAPFHLLQIWVWERFLAMRPEPNLVENGEPRFARWDKKKKHIENVRFIIDSAMYQFLWRPYVAADNNPVSRQFYREHEVWIKTADVESNTELLSFTRCLRVCELVGIDCIEQYLPHRVAMQFGFEQDVPDHVTRANQDHITAWDNYARPIGDQVLYFPSKIDSSMTQVYFVWWWDSSRTDLRNTSPAGSEEVSIDEEKNHVIHETLKGAM